MNNRDREYVVQLLEAIENLFKHIDDNAKEKEISDPMLVALTRAKHETRAVCRLVNERGK